jgi:hypothetical protein
VLEVAPAWLALDRQSGLASERLKFAARQYELEAQMF